MITRNCNSKIFFDFSYCFFIYPYLFAFFFLIEKDFLFYIKKAKKIEKYKMCVWSVVTVLPFTRMAKAGAGEARRIARFHG